jgi:plastocyanin
MAHSRNGKSRVTAALLTISTTLLTVSVMLGTLSVANAAPAQAAPKVHTIVMNKMAYGPSPARVRAGDVILWVNKDLFRHTATARDKSFNVDLAPGKSGRTLVRKPGTIAYFCRYHPGMKGQLLVGK